MAQIEQYQGAQSPTPPHFRRAHSAAVLFVQLSYDWHLRFKCESRGDAT